MSSDQGESSRRTEVRKATVTSLRKYIFAEGSKYKVNVSVVESSQTSSQSSSQPSPKSRPKKRYNQWKITTIYVTKAITSTRSSYPRVSFL
jgi:hypothetical protein